MKQRSLVRGTSVYHPVVVCNIKQLGKRTWGGATGIHTYCTLSFSNPSQQWSHRTCIASTRSPSENFSRTAWRKQNLSPKCFDKSQERTFSLLSGLPGFLVDETEASLSMQAVHCQWRVIESNGLFQFLAFVLPPFKFWRCIPFWARQNALRCAAFHFLSIDFPSSDPQLTIKNFPIVSFWQWASTDGFKGVTPFTGWGVLSWVELEVAIVAIATISLVCAWTEMYTSTCIGNQMDHYTHRAYNIIYACIATGNMHCVRKYH